jgi:hypothetical protein
VIQDAAVYQIACGALASAIIFLFQIVLNAARKCEKDREALTERVIKLENKLILLTEGKRDGL